MTKKGKRKIIYWINTDCNCVERSYADTLVKGIKKYNSREEAEKHLQ